jgi:signal peptidase II
LQSTAWIRVGATALAVVVLDQMSKTWIVDELGPDQISHRRDLLGSWFSFEYVQNRGAAFGLFAGGGGLVPALVAVGFIALVIALHKASRPNNWFLFGAGLVAGGALGNVIDRVRLGHVTDFVAVGTWWRFNLADSAVTVGVLILIWLSMQSRDERGNGLQ